MHACIRTNIYRRIPRMHINIYIILFNIAIEASAI